MFWLVWNIDNHATVSLFATLVIKAAMTSCENVLLVENLVKLLLQLYCICWKSTIFIMQSDRLTTNNIIQLCE